MLQNPKNMTKYHLLNKNQLVFKKYKILNLISEGNFGEIYLTVNEKNKKFYAMKAEKKESSVQILEQEAYYLYSIKGLGIPEFITFGKIRNYNILIEELLGKSLLDLFIENNYKFSIKDICLISLQLIDRLELIHSKTLIHRDIKPENCLIGLENPNIIYLTNFGFATKYCSSKTRKHITSRFRGTFTGTLKYCSANSQKGNQLSRRDDLESLGYTILFFMKGKLPWQNLSQNFNEKEIYLKIYAMKKYLPIKRLCVGCPPKFEEFFIYVRGLKFQEEPNYDYLRNIFEIILKDNNFENFEELNFSWIEDSQSIKAKKKKKRTLSPKTRLYNKIKSQIQIKNEINSDHNYIIGNLTSNNKQNIIKDNANQSLSLAKLNAKKINYELSKKIRENKLSFDNEKKNADNEIEYIIRTEREKEIIQKKEKDAYTNKYHTLKEKNKQYLNDNKMINYSQINDNKNHCINQKLKDFDRKTNITNINNNKIINKKNSKTNIYNQNNSKYILTDNNQIKYKTTKSDSNKNDGNRIFSSNKLNPNNYIINLSNVNKGDKIMNSVKIKNKRQYYNNKDYNISYNGVGNPKIRCKTVNNKDIYIPSEKNDYFNK